MAGPADVRWAQAQYDQWNALQDGIRRQASDIKNKFGNMSIGRMVGMAGGTLLGAAMGAPLLGIAAMGGLGGRAGAEIGSRLSNVDEVTAGKLFRRKAQLAREEGFEAQSDLNRMANVNIGKDAFSIWALGKTDMGKNFFNKFQNPGVGLPAPKIPETLPFAGSDAINKAAQADANKLFSIPNPTNQGPILDRLPYDESLKNLSTALADPGSGVSNMPRTSIDTVDTGYGMGTMGFPRAHVGADNLRQPNVNLLESLNLTDKSSIPMGDGALGLEGMFDNILQEPIQGPMLNRNAYNPLQDDIYGPYLNKGIY